MVSDNKPLLIGCGILAGCGGCLLLILLAGIPLSMFTWRLVSPLVRTTIDMGRMSNKIAQLNDKHPFAPPEDGAISPDRLDIFVTVRANAEKAIDDQLDWLLRYGESPAPSISGNFMNFMRLPSTLLGVTNPLLDHLGENEMSFQEYHWLVIQTAAQFHHWKEIQGDDELRRLASEYFAPFEKYHQQITAYMDSGAGKVEVEGLSYPDFLYAIDAASPFDFNREHFAKRAEQLTPHAAIIFLDAWIVHLGVSTSVNVHIEEFRFGSAWRLHHPAIPASIRT